MSALKASSSGVPRLVALAVLVASINLVIELIAVTLVYLAYLKPAPAKNPLVWLVELV